jgi:predicted nuclease of predicted toxin-antitoxin system
VKFLLDENVSQTVTIGLRDAGFDCVHVLETNLAHGSDEAIINSAKKQKRVIITHDKDFGNVLRYPLQNHYGVVLMRFKNQRPVKVLSYLLVFLKAPHSLEKRLTILREVGYRII